MTKLLLILGLLVGIFLPGESLAQENKSNFVHVSLVDRMQQDSKTECISDSVLSFGGGDIIQGEEIDAGFNDLSGYFRKTSGPL